MSRFQSRIVLIFIINICFIVGTDETNNTLKRPWLDLNVKPEDLGEPPAEIILADPNAQIPEGGSPNRSNKARQLNTEKLFYETEDTWYELRHDPNMTNGKWKIICKEMVIVWKTEQPLYNLTCKPEPYFKRWRRMQFEEFVNEFGNKAGLAPKLLLCKCEYYELVNGNLKEKKTHFGVKHYAHNDYFLLEIQKFHNSKVHIVRNIYTLNISS